MSGVIPEADWKQFKKVNVALQERFCQNALDELVDLINSKTGDACDRYFRAGDLLRKRDKEYSRAFGDFRRSTAVMQLQTMRHMGLLADEMLGLFSEPTQDLVRLVDPLSGTQSATPQNPPPSTPDSNGHNP